LSQNEIDMLRAQIQACWSPPVGVMEARDLVVVLQFGLNRDGSVSGEPFMTNRSGSALFQVAVESATRAVCVVSPTGYRSRSTKLGVMSK
jgi:TonB C terminal